MLSYETAAGEDLDLGTGRVNKTAPAGGTLVSTQISLSTFGVGGAAGSAATATWDPASIPAAQAVATTITVGGAEVGDVVLASFSSIGSNNLQLSAHVQAANTVRVVLANPTTAAIDASSGTLRVLAFRVR